MAVFDPTLDAAPVAEQNTDPILPEDRFIFELVGFERSEPDQWHRNGGIKWTFRVYNQDGSPFYFQNDHYELWRTTNVNAEGKPLFNLGTQAHDWASALLGRTLGVDERFSISEMNRKRFSAMVVWMPKKTKPGEKAATLASLRHVPVGTSAVQPSSDQVSADPSEEEVDRALLMAGLKKSVARLKKLDAQQGTDAEKALADSDANAALDELQQLYDQVKAAIQKALDD